VNPPNLTPMTRGELDAYYNSIATPDTLGPLEPGCRRIATVAASPARELLPLAPPMAPPRPYPVAALGPVELTRFGGHP
jgi:hypothetical protein